MSNIHDLESLRESIMKRANALVDKAGSEGRRFTRDEAAALDQLLDEAAELLEQIRALQESS
jgi:hypothetical protein